MRAREFFTESADEEAWELVGQPVPEIQAFVQKMGLANDRQSVGKIASAIEDTPDTPLPAASIARLKNLANKPGDPDILRAIQKISGRPDAAEHYVNLMARRDASEGRDRGYDVSNLVAAMKSGNYEPPVLLRLPSGVYVIGGRTRLYAALALNVPIKVKIIGPQTFAKQGAAEGSLNERRDALYNFVKSKFPSWPEYVLKDFLYAQAKGIRDKEELKDFLDRNQKDFGQVKWRLEKLPITLDIFTPKTQQMIKQREGGSSNPYQVPKDAERHALQQKMIQQKGVSQEPIIVAKLSNGYDLIEGWHRTIQHLKAYPQGYTGPAWVGYGATYTSESKQGVREVKILSKVKGKGSEPGQLPRFGRPIADADKPRYLGRQAGSMGRYEIWRDWLGGQLSLHLFDPQDRRVIVTTFGSQYKGNPDSYIIHGLYAAPGNPVRAADFYRALVRDLGLTLISDRKQSPGGNKVWQQLEQFPDIEVYGYDTATGEVKNFGARDAEMYAVSSQATQGSREMQRVARDLRLVATRK